MGIKHKYQSTRPDGPDDGDIRPSDWNDEHDVEGILGSFLDLAGQPNSVLCTDEDGDGGLTPLSAFMRSVLAAVDAAALAAALGAVAKTGDTMSGALAMGGQKITGLGTPTAAGDAVTKAYADAITSVAGGALVFKGAWSAAAGTFPGGGAALTGWFYKVTVAGTVNGVTFAVGDELYALVDNASTSTYAANWLKTGSSVTLSQISDASANGRSIVGAANYAAMRTLLGLATVAVSGDYADLSGTPPLGTAAALNVGTGNGNIPQLDGSGRLPAVDGSQLTNMPGGGTVGMIGFVPFSAAPAGYIKANGAVLSRATYPALWAAAQASGNMAASDAVWNSSGYYGKFSPGDGTNTFRIPFINGNFVRAFDDGAGQDPGRVLGSAQADEFKSHAHPTTVSDTTQPFNGADTMAGYVPTASATGAVGGSETRPKNVSFLAVIRYL